MRKIMFLLIILVAAPLFAQGTLEDADNAYMQQNYEEAAKIYEEHLTKGANADIYFNLGNTYYRLDNIGKSILNYERAKCLSPDDEDVLFNLELAQSRVEDQFNIPSEMFFITWTKEVVHSKTCNQWGIYGFMSLFIALILFGVYRFSDSLAVSKIAFYIGACSVIFCVLFNIAAFWSHYSYENDNRAVIMTQTQIRKDGSMSSEIIRELKPGTVIEVLDEESSAWWEVILPNGKKGWIPSSSIEKVKPQLENINK